MRVSLWRDQVIILPLSKIYLLGQRLSLVKWRVGWQGELSKGSHCDAGFAAPSPWGMLPELF